MNKLAIGLVGIVVGLSVGGSDRAMTARELTDAVRELQAKVAALENSQAALRSASSPPGQAVFNGLTVTKLDGREARITPNGTSTVVFTIKVRNVGSSRVAGRMFLKARDSDGDFIDTIEYQFVNPNGATEMRVDLQPGAAVTFMPEIDSLSYPRIATIEPVVK